MMNGNPEDVPVVPPPATVGQVVLELLLAAPDGARVKLLAGGREVWAAGIVKIDPDGNVVIC